MVSDDAAAGAGFASVIVVSFVVSSPNSCSSLSDIAVWCCQERNVLLRWDEMYCREIES